MFTIITWPKLSTAQKRSRTGANGSDSDRNCAPKGAAKQSCRAIAWDFCGSRVCAVRQDPEALASRVALVRDNAAKRAQGSSVGGLGSDK